MDICDYVIDAKTTVLDTMAHMDKSGKKTLFILEDGYVRAAVTNGDIRRWILSKGDLSAPIWQASNKKPKCVRQERRGEALEYMRREHLDTLPVVDADDRMIDIISLYDEQDAKPAVHLSLPVVIMAGGLGSRLYPYTKILPKPLLPIGDIPITEHIINRFRAMDCKDFYLVVNHKKNMVKAYFNEIEKDYNLTFVDEDIPLGTGGGVGLLRGMIDTPFILTNCDTLIEEYFEKIYKQHRESHNCVTMICSLKNIAIPYGVVDIGENGRIERMREKPKMSFFTNTGSYIVDPCVIDIVPEEKAIGFPDVVQKMMDMGKPVGVYPINEHAWLDMGQFDSLEEMRRRMEKADDLQ